MRMKMQLFEVPYKMFQIAYVQWKTSKETEAGLNRAYFGSTSGLLWTERTEIDKKHEQDIRRARYLNYSFGSLQLKNVYISAFQAKYDDKFEVDDGHVVPSTVDVIIEFYDE